MNPETTRRLGIAGLVVGIAVLLVNLAGMSGLITKVAPSRDLSMVALIFVVVGGALRRKGRAPKA
jgi:hypothetical protein